MKKIIRITAVVALLLAMMMPAGMTQAYADTYPQQDTDWRVTFDGEALTSNYDASVLQAALKGMEPGDEASLTFTLVNNYGEAVDWWMENEVIKSLEDQSKTAKNGAYTYEVTYTPASGGSAQVLYSSDQVGGEQTVRPGMHEATDALKDYLWLEQIPANGTAKLTIYFALDGETQSNLYQDTLAKLKVDFAVELPGSGAAKTMSPKTGDDSNLTVWILLAAASAIVLLLLAVLGRKNRKGGEA